MWLKGHLKQNTIKLRLSAKCVNAGGNSANENRGAVVNMEVAVNSVYS